MKMNNRKENQKKSDGKQTKASKDVRGSRATEVPEFIPTRYDLLELVEYWESERLRRQWDNFITGMFIEDCEAIFHSGRIARIAEVLGEEEVERAIDEVWERFSRRCNARRLDIFLHGDEEQWKAVQDEFHQERRQQCERRERRLAVQDEYHQELRQQCERRERRLAVPNEYYQALNQQWERMLKEKEDLRT